MEPTVALGGEHYEQLRICLAGIGYYGNPAGGSCRVTGTRSQERRRVMDNLPVNIEIGNLDELKKLLSTASELSKQLETTLQKINEIKLSLKTQVDAQCKY